MSADLAHLERRRERYKAACGCASAAAALLVALAALFVTRPTSVFIWIAVALGATLAGKLAGLGRARIALHGVERAIAERTP